VCSVQNRNTVSWTFGERRRYPSNARQGRSFARFSKDVRVFVGLASYYRKFIKGFVTIAEPLTRLTSKQTWFEWSSEAQVAFEALKYALMEATSLAYPIPNVPCILDTDASEVAVGAVLSQKLDGVERPIAFFSRVMSET